MEALQDLYANTNIYNSISTAKPHFTHDKFQNNTITETLATANQT